MKNIVFVIMAMLLFNTIGDAQDNKVKPKKIKMYKCLIKTANERVRGYLYEADEKGLKVSMTREIDLDAFIYIPAEAIDFIKFRRAGSVAKGILIGSVVGGTVGYLLGYSQGDDAPGWFSSSKEDKANAGTVLFSVLGGTAGALIGSSRKKREVQFNLQNYLSQIDDFKSFSILEQLGK